MSSVETGVLYLIPTPLALGTANDLLTPQIKRILPGLHFFLAENIRTARRYISSLNLNIVIEELKFETLDKTTSYNQVKNICAPLLSGKDIGVMSEAGCPGIADPGSLAVSFAHANNIRVIPLIGPSSIFLALMASGFNGQSFVFHGYLPIDKQHRSKRIRQLETEAARKKQTQIFMETPYRNDGLLLDIISNCRDDTNLCIARDISGPDELIMSRPIGQWRNEKPKLHKLPAIFLLYGA